MQVEKQSRGIQSMIIEAVVVSINFGDYLAETLPRNKPLFDRIVVVTSSDDWLTRNICRANSVEYIETERHLEGGGFDKGKAINDGMRQFSFRDWHVHLDSDVVVPKEFREHLPQLIIGCKPSTVFGCQRLMCESYNDWTYYQNTGLIDRFRKDNLRTHAHFPVGFFQLWHSDDHKWYPEGVPYARNSDLEFSKQFKYRCHSERSVIHLSADKWVRGRDDEGRRTNKWGPTT